jgi:hypothetical protein
LKSLLVLSLMSTWIVSCRTQFTLQKNAKNALLSNTSQVLYVPSVKDFSSVSGLSGPLTKQIKTKLLLAQNFELGSLEEAAFSVEVESKKLEFLTTRVLECVQKTDFIASKTESCEKPSSALSPNISAEGFVSSANASLIVRHLDSGKLVLRKNFDEIKSSEFNVVAPLEKQQELAPYKNLHSVRYAENQTSAIENLAVGLGNAIAAETQNAILNFLSQQNLQ